MIQTLLETAAVLHQSLAKYSKSSGRIGFISQESEAQFSQLKFYQMNFSAGIGE